MYEKTGVVGLGTTSTTQSDHRQVEIREDGSKHILVTRNAFDVCMLRFELVKEDPSKGWRGICGLPDKH